MFWRAPETRGSGNVTRLVEALLVDGASAAIEGLLLAQQLTSLVVEHFDLQAASQSQHKYHHQSVETRQGLPGGSMAVEVSSNEVSVGTAGRDGFECTLDGVGALLRGCTRSTLRDIILGVVVVGADTPVSSSDLLVKGSVVLLKVDAELLVILERLILPWDFLVAVQQGPSVVAGVQTTRVRTNIAGWVALFKQVATVAHVGEADDLAGGQVLDLTNTLTKRLSGLCAHTCGGTVARQEAHRDSG